MSQIINVAPGMNCYTLAATYLQDATQFIRIMQQNNLSDPVIYSVGTLVIPDVDLTLTGGIPQPQ